MSGYQTSLAETAAQHAAGRAADIRGIDGAPASSEYVEGANALMRARGATAAGPLLLEGAPSSLVPNHVNIGVE